MKDVVLFEHRTDGGALYYGIFPEGKDFVKGAILRCDGGELEIFTKKVQALGIKLVLNESR